MVVLSLPRLSCIVCWCSCTPLIALTFQLPALKKSSRRTIMNSGQMFLRVPLRRNGPHKEWKERQKRGWTIVSGTETEVASRQGIKKKKNRKEVVRQGCLMFSPFRQMGFIIRLTATFSLKIWIKCQYNILAAVCLIIETWGQCSA